MNTFKCPDVGPPGCRKAPGFRCVPACLQLLAECSGVKNATGCNLWQKMCPVVCLLFPGMSVGLSYHTRKRTAVFGDYSRNSTGKLN